MLDIVAEGGDCCDSTYEERTSEELVANNLEIAKLLLENGANMETKDGKGKTPVDLAKAKEENATNELFHKRSSKQRIHLAVSSFITETTFHVVYTNLRMADGFVYEVTC